MPVIPNSQHDLHVNRILAALPEKEYKRLIPDLEYVSFSLGDVLYEPDSCQHNLYFPTSCVVSLLYTMKTGMTTEMGLVGDDGVVGIALFMGGDTSPNRAMVQIAGGAYRMKAKILQREFKFGGAFQLLLLRYAQGLIIQVSQTAVCNRLHNVEQRLCRWLLLCHDRVHTNELALTQELISNMLGSRREGVTMAAGRLQDDGIITYHRGQIRILDRAGLEANVCECYEVVKNALSHLNRRLERSI